MESAEDPATFHVAKGEAEFPSVWVLPKKVAILDIELPSLVFGCTSARSSSRSRNATTLERNDASRLMSEVGAANEGAGTLGSDRRSRQA